jgi:hypothetical protein
VAAPNGAEVLRLRPGRNVGAPGQWPRRGYLTEFVISSRVLRGNPLGDPADRPIWVYLPPAYQEMQHESFPVI